MKTTIDVIITTTESKDVYFTGLTLLSKDEYLKYKKNIKPCDYWWWLRSPGSLSNRASDVYSDGSLYGSYVNYANGSVRPALIINPISNLRINTSFNYYGHKWTAISEDYALCDDAFCKMAFREGCMATDNNDYEASDVKKYLDEVWNDMNKGDKNV